jgi:uncharacterized protein with GYD domain
MPRYMIQANITPQATAAVLQNPADRSEAISPIFEAVGGNLERYYIGLEENAIFLIANVPDQDTLYALLIAFFAGGPWLSFRATPIMTASEAVDIFKRAGTVAYRPPGR